MHVPIAQLATGLVGSLFSGGKQTDRNESPERPRAVEPQSGAGSISPAQYRQILAEFDVRQISPRQFSQLIQELQETGELEPGDIQELQAIRVQLDGEGAAPDEPLDLLRWARTRAVQTARNAAVETSAAEAAVGAQRSAGLQRQTSWIERLDRAHQAALEGPLDLVA